MMTVSKGKKPQKLAREKYKRKNDDSYDEMSSSQCIE